jgi:uncharacterized pyridoxamine 5'-phosphate oxidase family protein
MANVLQECIQFANGNPICYLATVENDQPRVRTMTFWFADETGFYFQTSSTKEIPVQLAKNPKVEVCFYSPGELTGTMLRIAGIAEFVDDPTFLEKAFQDNSTQKNRDLYLDPSSLILFRIAHGKAHFWTTDQDSNLKEPILF